MPREALGCSTILISTIHLVLFDNSRMGCFWYMFKCIKKLKLELIEHNLGTGCVRLILISTFDFFRLGKVRLGGE